MEKNPPRKKFASQIKCFVAINNCCFRHDTFFQKCMQEREHRHEGSLVCPFLFLRNCSLWKKMGWNLWRWHGSSPGRWNCSREFGIIHWFGQHVVVKVTFCALPIPMSNLVHVTLSKERPLSAHSATGYSCSRSRNTALLSRNGTSPASSESTHVLVFMPSCQQINV